LLSAVLFARRIAHLVRVESRPSADGTTRYYRVVGQIFFASVDQFVDSFDFSEKVGSVEIGLEDAHLWDSSAVAALDKVLLKFSRNNVRVRLVGLNQASESLLDLLGVHRPVLTTRDPSG
jgi:sulfate permease, SulP family